MATTTTADIQTVRSGADKIKMVLSALLVLIGFIAFYFLRSKGVWAQWGVMALALAAAVGLTLASDWGKTFIAFCREAIKETKKVVWPKPKATWQMTGVVFGFVLLMALFLFAVDKSLEAIIFDLILGWRK